MNPHFIVEPVVWKAHSKFKGFWTGCPQYTLWHLREQQEQKGLFCIPLPFSSLWRDALSRPGEKNILICEVLRHKEDSEQTGLADVGAQKMILILCQNLGSFLSSSSCYGILLSTWCSKYGALACWALWDEGDWKGFLRSCLRIKASLTIPCFSFGSSRNPILSPERRDQKWIDIYR